MTKAVIVLGQARSGTSMTAGLLSMLGVQLNHVHNPSSQNPKGAFESHGFNSLTSKMHIDYKHGLSPEAMKEKWTPEIERLTSKFKSDLWGWKSALTHYTVEYFLPFLENPCFVVVTRNFNDNAKSLVVHRKQVYGSVISLNEAINDCKQSVAALEQKLIDYKDVPHTRTTYGEIKKNPASVIKQFGQFLGVEVSDELQEQAKEFIMADYSTI